MPDLLRSLTLDPAPPPFAVLRRADGPGVEVLLGDVVDVERLADIPLPDLGSVPGGPQVLALVPYRQVTERGFVCHDDAAPLRCLVVRDSEVVDLDHALALLPDTPVEVTAGGFDVDDDAYAGVVARVINDEIGRGEGANFVIRRDYLTRTAVPAPHAALRLLRRLLVGEPGAYWTFAVHAGDRTMVGATPERHVSVTGGQVLMNPISGTYRFPPEGPSGEGLLRFLADPKETEELFMVVDEELKMMSRVCDRGGQVLGPYLKQMSALAHTEYVLSGRTDLDVREVLRETMFAATVTGSPVQNAARVITRYETTGRGYYSGVLALIGQDGHGQQSRRTLDAPILIRTAHLGPDGEIKVPVGATLVRHSVPAQEVAETHAKAAGVLRALGALPTQAADRLGDPPVQLTEHPGVAQALARRNDTLAEFWLRPQQDRPLPQLAGRTALIVDAEDSWTAMLAHLLRRLGMTATVRRWDDVGDPTGFDLLLAGPGPGDPRDLREPRIARLRDLVAQRLASRRPLLAVCLSHQVLAVLLGLPIVALTAPYQGTQRRIDLFGRDVTVGYYNTYTAISSADPAGPSGRNGLHVAAEPDTGEVHALRGPGFASVQFHLESLLSTDGVDILADLTVELLDSQELHGAVGAHHGGVGTILGRAPREPLTEVDVRAWPLGIGAVRLRDGLAFVSAKHAGGFTLDDIDAIPEDGRRYELLDGVVVVSPAPNRAHQRAVTKLAALLLAAERPPARTLVAPDGVDLSIARRLQPDVLVLAAPDQRVPVLVIEVGSPSTRRYDREEKRRAYAEAGVASYWLVDVDEPAVEVLSLDRDGYRTTTTGREDADVEVAAPFAVRFRPADLLD